MQPDWRKVEEENPGLSVRSACFIGEGWNARAYLVNDELVFRFPKRPEHWEELNREMPAILHADLSRDHILVENDTVAGVIDFGDVNWGDSDYDFMYLSVDFGFVFAGR
jgi:aminoglycoside phosphotransferase (APT) family kinase protein